MIRTKKVKSQNRYLNELKHKTAQEYLSGDSGMQLLQREWIKG